MNEIKELYLKSVEPLSFKVFIRGLVNERPLFRIEVTDHNNSISEIYESSNRKVLSNRISDILRRLDGGLS